MPTPHSTGIDGIRKTKRGDQIVYRVKDAFGKERSKAFDSDKEGMKWAMDLYAKVSTGGANGKAPIVAIAEALTEQMDGSDYDAGYTKHIRLVADGLARAGMGDLKSETFGQDFVRWINGLHDGWWITTAKQERFRHTAKAPLKPNSKNKIVRELRTLIKFAQTSRRVGLNWDPLAGCKLPKPEKVLKPTFTIEELRAIVSSKNSHHDWWLPMCVMVYTGARVSEVMNLEWKHVNLTARSIRFYGKGDKERVVPMQPELHEVLMGELVEGRILSGPVVRSEAMRASGSAIRECERTKEQPHPDYSKGFRRALDAFGLTEPGKRTPHSTRHTYIALQLAMGVEFPMLMLHVGHEQAETTLRYGREREKYTHGVKGWPHDSTYGTMCLRHAPDSEFHAPKAIEEDEDEPVVVTGG